MQFIVQGYPCYAYTGGRPFEPGKRAIVFVHGAAFDHSVWQWQSRYFAHHGWSVLAVDLPGHGRSPGAIRESIEQWAEWLSAFIEAAALDKPVLVGHSMGSLIVLATALRDPARVSRVALVGTASPMPVSAGFLAAAREEQPVGLDMEAVWGHSRAVQLQTSPVPGTSLLSATRRLNGRSKDGALAAALQACNSYRVAMEKVSTLDIPALVVAGKRDQMTAFKAGKEFAAQIPGAKLVALDAGHSMMSEAPRELLSALRGFLDA
jgi:pimeloyl-ACP methyl ester carboxylesterase